MGTYRALRLGSIRPTRPACVVDVGSLGTGTYQVHLEARDVEDLHEVVARTSFAIGEVAPSPSPPVVRGPEPMETGARWLFAAGLGLLIGVVAVRTRLRDLPTARPVRLRRVAIAGGALVVVGRLTVLMARAVALGGPLVDGLGTVLRTSDAQRLVPLAVALGCVAVSELPNRAVWLDGPVRMRRDLTHRQLLGWFGVVDLAVLAAWGGHSALDGSLDALTVVAKTGHLVGLGLWIGVLAVVLAVHTGRVATRSALRTMSRTAVAGAFVTVVSGLLLASSLVVSTTALLATPYGVVLTAKTLMVAIGVLLGLAARRARTTRLARLELSVFAVVALLGAGIATATPAIDPGFTNRAHRAPVVQPARQVDDLLLQARAIPGRPGINTIELRIGETRRPNPGPVTAIEVRVGDDVLTAAPGADGLAYIEGVQLDEGENTVQATVHRADWPDGRTSLIVEADPQSYVHAPVVSSAPIGGVLTVAAGMLSLAGVGLVLHGRRRRIRSTRQVAPPPTAGSLGDAPIESRDAVEIS